MEMIEVKTSELIGHALNFAMARVAGYKTALDEVTCGPDEWIVIGRELMYLTLDPEEFLVWSPSTDWSQGGPLIDEYAISIMKPLFDDGIWIAERINETGEFHSGEGRQVGGTALIAMCRSLVSVLVGDTVSVPKELMQ